MTTRGEKNNNPGNIRLSDVKFQGEIDGDDDAFKTFESAHYGLRAIARILLTYYNNYGLNTVRGLIMRWAPGSENPTDSYIANVARWCGVEPLDVIDVTDEKILDKLLVAIVKQENGEIIYDSNTVTSAVDSALGV